MVLDQHDIPNFVVRIESTRSVGGDEMADSNEFHDSNGHRAFPKGISFIVVKASLHTDHGDVLQVAEN